jgi:outer membrane protein assembly factor BamB
VSTLTENGHEVSSVGGSGSTVGPDRFNASLRRADALVVVNPSRRYSAEQAAGVRAFAEAGGRVLVLSDPPQTRVSGGLFSVSTEQVGGKTTSLTSPLGIAFGDDHLYHTTRNANNYRAVYATPAGESDLAAGVDRVVFRGAAPVVSADGETVLSTVEGTTVSSSRRDGTYPVVARVGNVTAIGDSEVFARQTVYDADNEAFAGNVADFLVRGEKAANAPVPPTPSRPPGASGPVPAGGPLTGSGTPAATPSPSG